MNRSARRRLRKATIPAESLAHALALVKSGAEIMKVAADIARPVASREDEVALAVGLLDAAAEQSFGLLDELGATAFIDDVEEGLE